MLRAAATGEIGALILLGADPLTDFPDRKLAEDALAGAATVIALDQFLTRSARRADVVFPVAGFAEVAGTTTNLEGRSLPLGQRVTPPGTAQPDWVIAAEIARRLGADLAITSVHGAQDEIRRLAPSRAASGVAEEVELPSLLEYVPAPVADPPPVDSYSLRLVATRKLYDDGVLVQHAASLSALAPGTVLRVNGYDFDRLGVEEGSVVRVKSPRGSINVEIRIDNGIPRGSAAIAVNQPGVPVSELIDASERVTDVRIERGDA
jgi:predicted molibdopterin-dependent oxidoreductase YjgC